MQWRGVVGGAKGEGDVWTVWTEEAAGRVEAFSLGGALAARVPEC